MLAHPVNMTKEAATMKLEIFFTPTPFGHCIARNLTSAARIAHPSFKGWAAGATGWPRPHLGSHNAKFIDAG
jgi:hypothetical protein